MHGVSITLDSVQRHGGNSSPTPVAHALVPNDNEEDGSLPAKLAARAAIMRHQQLWRDVMRIPSYSVDVKKLAMCHIGNAANIYKELNCPFEASVREGNCNVSYKTTHTRTRCTHLQHKL